MSLLKAMLMGGRYDPKDFFKVVTYVGSGTVRSITGLGFAPDFVWIKERPSVDNHLLFDRVRGVTNYLVSNQTLAQGTDIHTLTAFDDDGFTVGVHATVNAVGVTYVAWCWKADNTTGSSNTDGTLTSVVSADKNFSIVKFTGNSTVQTVGHGLGSAPKLIIVKSLNAAGDWFVYTEALANTEYLVLNTTAAKDSSGGIWNSTNPTSSVFSIGTGLASADFIAYCFAELPGLTSTGSYTGTGATGNTVTCGFQPAFVLIKGTNAARTWFLYDNKRDPHNPNMAVLFPNVSDAEVSNNTAYNIDFTSTGFTINGTSIHINSSTGEYMYLAFAELPQKDSPENKDEPLFNILAYTGNGANGYALDGLGFKPDLIWLKCRSAALHPALINSLRGAGRYTLTSLNQAEVSVHGVESFDEDGFTIDDNSSWNTNLSSNIAWCWNAGGEVKPNAIGTLIAAIKANVTNGFSMVEFTGNGVAGATFEHGLDEAPKVVLVKRVTTTGFNWIYYSESLGATKVLYMHDTGGAVTNTMFNNTAPTSTLVTLGSSPHVNALGVSYVAYCFHDTTSISKFGAYTGTGVTKLVTGLGFRPDFVRIKRTDAAASWITFDVKRGATNWLCTDLTNVETTDDTTLISFNADGFTILSKASCNASGGEYIYEAFKIGDNTDTLHQIETGQLQVSCETGSLVDDNGTHTLNATNAEVAEDDFGAELCPNGSFTTDVTGWTPYLCTLASVVGGQAGNCCELTTVSGASQQAYNSANLVLIPGVKYKVKGYVKSGTAGNVAWIVWTYDTLNSLGQAAGTSSSSWEAFEYTFIATNKLCTLRLQKNTTTAGTILFDEITCQLSEVPCGSYQLDFNSGYTAVVDAPDFDFIQATNASIDAWVRHTGVGVTAESYAFHYEDADNYWRFYHVMGSGLAFIGRTGGVDVISTGSFGEITDKKMHHVAMQKIGDDYLFYKDGILIKTYTNAASFGLTGYFYVGHGFYGEIDQWRLKIDGHLWESTNFNLTDKGLYYPSGTLNR